MYTLQSLRQARPIIRWMLVCFALSIGVAIASPVVHPQSLQLICTASGTTKLVPTDNSGGAGDQDLAHTLDCVLCLPAVAPPPGAAVAPVALELGEVLHTQRPAFASWRLADPTSARDPPVLI